jgi:two-component system OmpR family response regulator
MSRVLLVEDEPSVRLGLRLRLRQAGFEVLEAGTALEAWDALPQAEVVVLDWILPDEPGIRLLDRLRRNDHFRNLPVLMLSARSSESERVEGLSAGADDYLTKPFHMEELLARVRALIRRAQGLASPMLQCGALTLDTRSGRVTCDGQPVALTGHEFRLLAYLMHRPGAVVSRGELTEHLYAQDFDRDSNTIEVFVGRLRRKLPPGTIETVRGLGYRLAAPS